MLTDGQVQKLFIFCEKHFVREYDVQVELVDHLANAIEAIIEEDPAVSFEEALSTVHARFGVLGFSGVVNSRTRMLEKQYSRMKKELFLSYFTWPKIGMTACLIAVLLFIGRWVSNEVLYYLMAVVFLSVYVFDLYVLSRAIRNVRKQKKELLITKVSYTQSFLMFVAGGFLSGMIKYEDMFDSPKQVILYSGYIVFVVLSVLFFLGIIAYKSLVEQVQKQARSQYPEAFA
jgi:hypothetical protein